MSLARSLDSLLAQDLEGRYVIVRSDLNTPLEAGTDGHQHVSDDSRICASLPVWERLTQAGAKVIVLAHLGRPTGRDEALSLRPVAARAAELAGVPVAFCPATVGAQAQQAVEGIVTGGVLVLENVRFDPRETSKDASERSAYAEQIVSLVGEGTAFVEDAFGAVHRQHASVYELAAALPAYQGDLVAREVDVLGDLLGEPARPYVVVLGGSKVSDKIGVIDQLLGKADQILLGGGMLFTFLAAQGYAVGKSMLEPEQVGLAARYVEQAQAQGTELVLPSDVVVAERFAADATHYTVHAQAMESSPLGADGMGLDIGPQTAEAFAKRIAQAGTVFWNGPMGVFEFPAFAAGTRAVAAAMLDSHAFTVVGGGDSAAALGTLGIDGRGFGHISTGGGASLEFLEGKDLPGLRVLERSGE